MHDFPCARRSTENSFVCTKYHVQKIKIIIRSVFVPRIWRHEGWNFWGYSNSLCETKLALEWYKLHFCFESLIHRFFAGTLSSSLYKTAEEIFPFSLIHIMSWRSEHQAIHLHNTIFLKASMICNSPKILKIVILLCNI